MERTQTIRSSLSLYIPGHSYGLHFGAKYQTLAVSHILEEGESIPLPDFVCCDKGNHGPGDNMLEMTLLSTNVCVSGDENEKGPSLEITSIGLITKNSKFTKKC
ncbi:hypothetical protein HA466_0007610 [Hirschfeldia incana]|nr:hypothetical protein HA466_0007610 [Hirschfeldia incana]KAJ0266832.1 hypothetical protein HA466_0007610 [Hirschfeldia incana]